ncbi:hypothetical protein ACIBG4_05730 [Nonomuraea sp. NPDC050383]|uniref:hypothetical protein n=1 Tax=Nonomuraea sp. NPDC050383 TaxID=3364362 RepID=UPI0037B96EDE
MPLREPVETSRLPMPDNPDHHFVFDHGKRVFYVATCCTWLVDDDRADEHARETLQCTPARTVRPTPRCVSLTLTWTSGIVHAGAAVDHGMAAFDIDRRFITARRALSSRPDPLD